MFSIRNLNYLSFLTKNSHKISKRGSHLTERDAKTFFQHRCISDEVTLKEIPKDIHGTYPTAYDPKAVEEGWYEWWEENGFFKPVSPFQGKVQHDDAPVVTLVLPPPNITGNLHLGHTLTAAIQDSIARWHRMKGHTVHWIPGYDHGGIATQTVVEKKLFRERKLNRHDLGRKRFLEEVSIWKEITQKNIENQLKKIGSSLDFTQSSFTMDENASKAVAKVFIQLFEDNLIYRKEKMVNWSCEIKSVISDIEVDHLEIPGKTKLRFPGLSDPLEVGILDFFYYKVVDSVEKVLIATTRLETILGDTALAVNPDDARYSHLIGRQVQHPFTGENMPIVADESINKAFGTGIMKVTPSHDFSDYELGLKHNLPIRDILNDDGTIKNEIDIFGGKHRLAVRKLIKEALHQKGLYLESRSHAMTLPVCSRTGDIIEPRLKAQWYLDCQAMGEQAVKDAQEKNLRFTPEFHEKKWYEWFKHLKDWCISRQLWWGHQIPVYKITNENISDEMWIAASSQDEAIKKASLKLNVDPSLIRAIQDEDILDTWFSSALYPLTALGWPSEEISVKNYPLHLMETGFDILFFWVARMVMLNKHITGKLPFNEVLLHGMICDSHGRKMTKSLGNTIDPADVMQGISLENLVQRAKESYSHGVLTPEELKTSISGYNKNFPRGISECGTDGLRFSLLSYDVLSERINLDVQKIRVCRNFCNKIWQGIRLFTIAIEKHSKEDLVPLDPSTKVDITDVDQWILSRLSDLVTNCNSGFETYNFHFAAAAMHKFWVINFCDVYLESIKPILMSDDDKRRLSVCQVLLTCIEVFLHVISPIMPFLSEELYQRISSMTSIHKSPTITLAPYPDAQKYSVWRNTVLEADLHTVNDLVEIARSLKTQHGATKLRPNVTIAVEQESTLVALSRFSSLIATLARLESVTFHLTQRQEFFEHHPQDSWVFKNHEHGISVIMDIGEKMGLLKQNADDIMEGIRQELSKLNKMVSDSGYRKKAPLSVKEKHMAKKASLEGELQRLLNLYGKQDSETTKADSSVS